MGHPFDLGSRLFPGPPPSRLVLGLSHEGSRPWQQPPVRVQLRSSRLSRKNYGGLRQNQYAHQQAAILYDALIASFGGGIRSRQPRRIAVDLET
jgi:hypothetical protein